MRKPYWIDLNVDLVSSMERVIETIGHENYHHIHGLPPDGQNDEFFAEDAGYKAVMRYREWRGMRRAN